MILSSPQPRLNGRFSGGIRAEAKAEARSSQCMGVEDTELLEPWWHLHGLLNEVIVDVVTAPCGSVDRRRRLLSISSFRLTSNAWRRGVIDADRWDR